MYISSNSVGCGSRSYTSCLSWIPCLVLLSDTFCHCCVGGPIVIWNVRISMGFRTMVKGSASSSFTFSDWNFRLLPAQQSAEEMVKTALSMNLGFVCKLLSECLNLSLSFTTLCVCVNLFHVALYLALNQRRHAQLVPGFAIAVY